MLQLFTQNIGFEAALRGVVDPAPIRRAAGAFQGTKRRFAFGCGAQYVNDSATRKRVLLIM
jgi:hypothetical protein